MNNKVYLIFAILFIAGCGKKNEAAVELESFPVSVEKAVTRVLEEKLAVTGSIKGKNEATLFSRVPGKLKKYLLKEGDPVKRDQAVAQVERDEVGVVFEPAPVPSTLNGVVGRTYLDDGQNVSLDTPVALVVDDGEVIARADIPERYTGQTFLGQKVQINVEAYPEQMFAGEVSRVSQVVDPASRSALVEVRVPNPKRLLKSGMFAELTFSLAKKGNALAIPAEALLDGKPPFVFVAEEGKARKREVKAGLVTDQFVEIQTGVKEGDMVITSGLFALQDGSPVEIIPSAKPEEAPKK